MNRKISSPNTKLEPGDIADSVTFGPNVTTHESSQMWSFTQNRYIACEKAIPILAPGQYNILDSEFGIAFMQHEVNTDKLFVLPDTATEQIIADIELFWTKEKHFRSLEFLWKRGIMLHGAPGSGKTSCLQQISERIIEKGGVSFYIDNPSLGAHGLSIFRKIEPNRPILVMLEDIDAIINIHGESSLLSLLDGERQIDNVVFVATTNYPEQLDARIINRPSRFDEVVHVGMPTPEARRIYLSNVSDILRNDATEMDNWVAKTDDFSIAHLKELLLSVEVFDVPMDDTISRLRSMMNTRVTSEHHNNKEFGFMS